MSTKSIEDVEYSPDGSLGNLRFTDGRGCVQRVRFRDDRYAGPAVVARLRDDRTVRPEEIGLRCTVRTVRHDRELAVEVHIENGSADAVEFTSLSLTSGVDTYMESFPRWRGVYFPTLLRCERTHFWGYAMTPDGDILGLASPDAIASWTMHYEHEATDNPDFEGWAGLHRINSFSLDLMHRGPLPARHPTPCGVLRSGERRDWTLFLFAVGELDEMKPAAARLCRAPMIVAPRYSVTVGEEMPLHIIGACSQAAVLDESGERRPVAIDGTGRCVVAPDRPGLYRFIAESREGAVTEALLSVLHPWSWYLDRARDEALRLPQFASSHCEQWMGLHSAFLARRHTPRPETDRKLQRRFEAIFDAMWSRDTGRPIEEAFGDHVYRLFTNSAQMIAVLCDAYEAGAGLRWLETAAKTADYLAEWQTEEGYYAVPDCLDLDKRVIYTTVLYPAKCILELCMIERKLGATEPIWKERYRRHYRAAGRAIAHLERVMDDLNTEGQDTFEDGMIACSSTQMGLFALLQGEADQRRRYTTAAETMLDLHRCLEQSIVPDGRMNGCTLRFWEAQYDVLARKGVNMMNSPHGWTAWSLYGAYYLYLLTGKRRWLDHLHNGIGACVQVVDGTSGELRWAFVTDPYVEATLLEPDPDRPGRGRRYDAVFGECYLSMIADFHVPDREPVLGNSPANGWTCCNDVHEIFKCMEETVLTTAFVLETDGGEYIGRNCRVTRTGTTLTVTPLDHTVCRVHMNTIGPVDLEIRFADAVRVVTNWCGRGWACETGEGAPLPL